MSTEFVTDKPIPLLEQQNAFEAMCKMASNENWCWKIICTTCGHMYFRYGLRELAKGKHPDMEDWIPGKRYHHQMGEKLGPMPILGNFSMEEQACLVTILLESSIKEISSKCKFPDWLGYLGLGLVYTSKHEQVSRNLTESWIPQLLNLLPKNSSLTPYFHQLVKNTSTVLSPNDLEKIETDLLKLKR